MKRAVATLRMAMGDLRAVEQRTRAAEAAAEAAEAAAEAAERRRRDAEAAARRVWQGGGYELWVHALGALQRAFRMTGRRPVDPGTESELDRLLDSRDVADPAELVRRVEAVDRRYPRSARWTSCGARAVVAVHPRVGGCDRRCRTRNSDCARSLSRSVLSSRALWIRTRHCGGSVAHSQMRAMSARCSTPIAVV